MDQQLNSDSKDDLLDNFKTEFIKTLQELQNKRQQLEDYRCQMAESVLRQHELEHKLENEKRKNANDEFNNMLMKNGNDALETERQSLSRELAMYKSRNNMISVERDSLYAEARVQALANLKLKESIKELEHKQQCHLQFQNDLKDRLDKTVLALKTIMPTIVKIQQKQENVQEMFDNMSKFDSLLLTVKHIEKLKDQIENERNVFENKFIIGKAECMRLRELLDSLSINQSNEESKLTVLWKEQAIYLQTKLIDAKQIAENMENTLRVAMETVEISRKSNDNIGTIHIDEGVQRKETKQRKDAEIQTDGNICVSY